jgi:hypothetical protein
MLDGIFDDLAAADAGPVVCVALRRTLPSMESVPTAHFERARTRCRRASCPPTCLKRSAETYIYRRRGAPDGQTTNVFLDAPVDLRWHAVTAVSQRLRMHGSMGYMRFQAPSGQH